MQDAKVINLTKLCRATSRRLSSRRRRHLAELGDTLLKFLPPHQVYEISLAVVMYARDLAKEPSRTAQGDETLKELVQFLIASEKGLRRVKFIA